MEPIGSCKDCGLEYTANMASWRGIEHSKDACIKRMHDQLAASRAEVAEAKAVAIELRRQIANQQANNVTRNRELDALHYVWCDGGCAGGVHRWQESPPTEEIVTLAIRNTRRLAHWWDGHIMRAHPELTKARYQSHLEIEETVRELQSQLDAAREREGAGDSGTDTIMHLGIEIGDAIPEFKTILNALCGDHFTDPASMIVEAIEALVGKVAANAKVQALESTFPMRKRVWFPGDSVNDLFEDKEGAVPMWWLKAEVTKLRKAIAAAHPEPGAEPIRTTVLVSKAGNWLEMKNSQPGADGDGADRGKA